MIGDRLCDCATDPADLQSLFQIYRASLPEFKQALVSDAVLKRPTVFPGLVGYEDGEPAVALLWRFLDVRKEIVTVDFYVESPRASAETVQNIIAGFMEKTRQARTTCFEVWTAPKARIHLLLPEYGFVCRKRRLMGWTGPSIEANGRADLQCDPLNDIDVSLETLDQLAELVSDAYAGTGEAAFYEHLYMPPHGQSYLLGAFASPAFDFSHSMLGCSGSEKQPLGLLLCFQWPQAQTLYIEQLAVRRQCQGQGVGRALLSRLLGAAPDDDIASVLLTVSDENIAARRLYESLGFSLLEMENAYLKRSASD